ncbi:hypothetical protein H0H93_001322 [Arthromyces matolae]|nr:hypothetical protein H0H93_001322 [Arthromyces matolae]
MGRRKLYHSKEERRLAKNSTSRRHYDRNKSAISEQRSVRTAEPSQVDPEVTKQKSGNDHSIANSGKEPQKGHPLRPSQDLSYWVQQVRKLHAKHTRGLLFEQKPFNYVDNLYHEASVTGTTSQINEAMVEHSNLIRSIEKCQEKILNLSGIAEEWKAAEDVRLAVAKVLRSLEDMACAYLEDPLKVEERHQNFELLYQTVFK